MKGKAPAFQWYPGDFRRDTAVAACSFEARALWREILDLMHDGTPRGHLTAGGVPITPADLARIAGLSLSRVTKWLRELEDRNVFSRREDGVIYSRRMVKDEETRMKRAAGGPKSLEHENVPRPKHEGSPSNHPSDHPSDHPSAYPSDHPLQLLSASAPSGEKKERESAGEAIELLAREAFGGAFDEIERFLGTRKAETRENWLREMIKIVSPGSQYVATDVTGACSDALALEKPIGGPHALRAFAEKRRQERTPVPPSERAGARRGSSIGILSASDAYVDKIMALMQSTTNGRGVVEFIPKTKVAELGAQVLAAYSAIGGVDRFLVAKKEPDKLVWLRRDFSTAFANAIHATPPTTEAAGASP